jgi:mRNA interferase RelE/StbE
MEKYFNVVIERSAIKRLSKLDKAQQIMLFAYIKKTLEGYLNPREFGTPLKGTLKEYWRYRVGDYRIIADINDLEVKIIVIEVGHRKEIYQKI